jgi:hypothetical protein
VPSQRPLHNTFVRSTHIAVHVSRVGFSRNQATDRRPRPNADLRARRGRNRAVFLQQGALVVAHLRGLFPRGLLGCSSSYRSLPRFCPSWRDW